MPKKFCVLLIVVIALGAAVLRVPCLKQRPMHCDEAVHAQKFAALLEKGYYVYDPGEYHGPTLNYCTLVPAWLTGAQTYQDITEFTLRIVPVFFGILLVLLLGFLISGLGCSGAVIAAFITAVSPALVYYSRYYIQETLLVCFTFGVIISGYRFSRRPNIGWAIMLGACLGLMHATKETCLIAYTCLFTALVILLFIRRREGIPLAASLSRIKLRHILALLVAGGVFAELFLSSFLTNLKGIPDSFNTFLSYFDRAGTNPLHIHPWNFYLKLLLFSQYGDGPIWSEGLIIILALAGVIAALRKKSLPGLNHQLLRFLTFYTLLMILAYSVIPYKTPWCVLGFLHGLILLAGVGAATLLKCVPGFTLKSLVAVLLLAGLGHLTWQAYRASYTYSWDPRNPYVYAHTSADVYQVAHKVNGLADFYRAQYDQPLPVQVFFPDNYWPLPWYFRSLNLNVGYPVKVPEHGPLAPVIISSVGVQDDLIKCIYDEQIPFQQREMYVSLFGDKYLQLRPQVEIRGFVKKSLWDKWRESEKDTSK